MSWDAWFYLALGLSLVAQLAAIFYDECYLRLHRVLRIASDVFWWLSGLTLVLHVWVVAGWKSFLFAVLFLLFVVWLGRRRR